MESGARSFSRTSLPGRPVVPPTPPPGVAEENLEPLDILLKQIISGFFLLTDGQGAVSKWSEPAELLFGLDASEALGHGFFEKLLDPAVAADAAGWRAFLEQGEAPTTRAQVEVTARHADTGRTFPMEVVFVPVKLDEGFDFSLFLEDLGFELPMNLMLARMRQQHPVVVRALRAALEPQAQPWEGWRTAGTLVAFRPLAPTPWVEEELSRREAERAEKDAEVEERLTDPDPGVRGDTIHELDDAAAVVARLLSALERIDELERVAGNLPSQLEEARKEVDETKRRAEAAEREAAEVRRALSDVKPAGADVELLARLERLERARLDEQQTAFDATKALERAEAARRDLAGRLEQADAGRAELEARLEIADAARAEVLHRLNALEREREAASAEAETRLTAAQAAADQRADAARSALEARVAELEAARTDAAAGTREELATELERLRSEHADEIAKLRAARESASMGREAEIVAALQKIDRERAEEAEAQQAELTAGLERI
jgi:PAS domain S-box-containing protein